MDAPKSQKAKRILRKKGLSPFRLIKSILLGKKNGLYTEDGHEAEIDGKNYRIEKVETVEK